MSGRRFYSGMKDGMAVAGILLVVLNSIAGGVSAEVRVPRVPVTAIAFSPDGERILIPWEKGIRVHDLVSGKKVAEFDCDFRKITAMTFGPDETTLAVAGGTPAGLGGVQFYQWPEGRPIAVVTNHSDVATGVQFNTAGTAFVVTGADNSTGVYRWPNRTLIYKLEGHSGPVQGAAFSPDDELIVTVSADRSIKVWNTAAGHLLRSFSHHTDQVHGVTFRPRVVVDGEPVPYYCATASQDKTVRIWQPGIGRMVRIVRGHQGPVFAVAYSKEGDKLYSAGKDGVVRVFDADSDEMVNDWIAHDDWIYSMKISPNGLVVATGDWKGVVKLWNIGGERAKLLFDIK